MHRKQVRRDRTFGMILDRVTPENSARLMERARLANRLAKSLGGRSRIKAYRIKHRALVALTIRFPERVNISRDRRLPEFAVVTSLVDRCGLHAPSAVLRDGLIDSRAA